MKRTFVNGARAALFATLITSLAVSSGCSKEDKSQGNVAQAPEKSVAESPLLQRLPKEAQAVFHLDLASKPAGRLQNWESTTESIKKLQQKLQEKGEAQAARALEIFNRSTLFPKESGKTGTAQELVGFATVQQVAPQIGLIARIKGEAEAKTEFATIRGGLSEAGIPPAPEQLEGGDAFSVAVQPQDPKKATETSAPQNKEGKKIYLAQRGNLLAMGSDLGIVTKLVDPQAPTGPLAVLESPAFRKASSIITDTSDQYGYFFVDITSLAQQLKSYAPPAQAQEVQKLDEMPFSHLLASLKASDVTSGQFVIVPSEKLTPEQKNFFDKVSTLKGGLSLKEVTPSSAVSLSIDGALIKLIKDIVAPKGSLEEGQLVAFAPFYEGLENLTLGIQTAKGGSPFPDIVIKAHSSNAAAAKTTLLTVAKGGLSANGLMAGDWQTKQVAGVTTSYTLTPFGAGLFVAENNGVLAVATSELAMQDILQPSANTSLPLPTEVYSVVEQGNPVVLVLTNYEKLYELMNALKGTLGMFTGGKNTFDISGFEELRKYKASLGSLSIKEGMINFIGIGSITEKK